MNEKEVCLFFDEKKLTKLLKHLPDDDIEFRPYLQVAGENVFGWNRNGN